jgi:protein-L-isoaspartate(D-aspartate) O-methyltransferase
MDPAGPVVYYAESTSRENMVRDQIESRGVRNPAVLRAMLEVPRHLFVPPADQFQAYHDCPLPIGYGATISQPFIVAYMTELLKAEKHHRILEIGTGSGYQAALLSQLAAQVYSVESVPELARTAAERLQKGGYANVEVRRGDGYGGWPEQAPFDRIIVTAAPPEMPEALIEQLAPGGRLLAPVGSASIQHLTLIDKQPDGSLVVRRADEVSFVPMVPCYTTPQ